MLLTAPFRHTPAPRPNPPPSIFKFHILPLEGELSLKTLIEILFNNQPVDISQGSGRIQQELKITDEITV